MYDDYTTYYALCIGRKYSVDNGRNVRIRCTLLGNATGVDNAAIPKNYSVFIINKYDVEIIRRWILSKTQHTLRTIIGVKYSIRRITRLKPSKILPRFSISPITIIVVKYAHNMNKFLTISIHTKEF